MCIDRDGQVAFFTKRGKVLLGAPPAHPVRAGPTEPEEREDPDPGPELGPELELFTGTPRYKRDSDMPWEVEARAWDILDPP